MATERLIAIVVLSVTIGAAAFCAKHFQLTELYAVAALLTYFLGTLTGMPTRSRVEKSLARMPRAELDSIYERVTGRPPREPVPPVRFEGNDG